MPTIDKTIGQLHDARNSRIRKIGRYVGASTYVTGGETFNPADIGIGIIECLQFTLATNGTLYRQLIYIVTAGSSPQTGRVRWLDATNGTEIANGTDLSGYSCRFEAIGR